MKPLALFWSSETNTKKKEFKQWHINQGKQKQGKGEGNPVLNDLWPLLKTQSFLNGPPTRSRSTLRFQRLKFLCAHSRNLHSSPLLCSVVTLSPSTTASSPHTARQQAGRCLTLSFIIAKTVSWRGVIRKLTNGGPRCVGLLRSTRCDMSKNMIYDIR